MPKEEEMQEEIMRAKSSIEVIDQTIELLLKARVILEQNVDIIQRLSSIVSRDDLK